MTRQTLAEQTPASVTEIRSSWADDPDMAEILSYFVDDAPAKIERFQEALRRQDYDQIRVLAHQLKGSAAGYGFESLSDLAREVETSANRAESEEVIAQHIHNVIEYLAAIRH